MTGDIFPLQALHRYFHFTLFALTNCFFFPLPLVLLFYRISSSFFITFIVCVRDNERVFLCCACIQFFFYNYDKLISTNDNHKCEKKKRNEKHIHRTDTKNNMKIIKMDGITFK